MGVLFCLAELALDAIVASAVSSSVEYSPERGEALKVSLKEKALPSPLWKKKENRHLLWEGVATVA